mmetsp:Transcript_33976/g.66350  ORF Transcript_33976/g.66350 Transcript_33976/m.66350 type:complete len:229 (-) Transcript_33976:213-899(-)
MSQLKLIESLPNYLAEGRRLIPPDRDRLCGGDREGICRLLRTFAYTRDEGEPSSNSQNRSCQKLRRLAGAVVFEEVLDDVSTLIHLSASVGINHVREHGLAAALNDEGAVDCGVAGAGFEENIKIQDGSSETNFGTEGAALKLVQLHRLGRTRVRPHRTLLLPHVPRRLEHRILPGHILGKLHPVAISKGTITQRERESEARQSHVCQPVRPDVEALCVVLAVRHREA